MSLHKRALGVLIAAAFVAGACGSSNPSATPTTPPASSPPAGQSQPASQPPATPTPAQGAIFKFLVDGEPSTFAGASNDLPTTWFDYAVYNALYTLNNKISPVPDIAAAMPETSADGLTWTVKLRTDVKFHDGTALTADDVKFSYDILQSKNCNQNSDLCSAIQDNLASVTVKDPSTVVFQLKQKYAPFMTTGLAAVYIMPQKAIMDSLKRLQGNTSGLDAAAVYAEDAKVSAAISADACGGDKPPASCGEQWIPEITAILNQAKITLPDQNKFKDDKGNVDNMAYGVALADALDALSKTISAGAVDQAAASLKIIDFANNPIGTGPYKFSKYTAGQGIELVRNDNFYLNKVLPAKVYIPIIKDAATASAALQKGDINWQQEVTSDARNAIKSDQNLFTATYPDFGYYYIGFNVRPGKLYSDLALRTAFTECIDHDATVKVATDDNGIPVYADVPPASWAFNPDVPKYKLDVNDAKAKIEGAGWKLGGDGIYAKNGKRLSSQLFVRQGRPERVKFAQLARDQLKKCGIEVVVKEADFATVLIPQVVNYPNNFDTYLGGWSSSTDPDDYSLFHSSKASSKDLPEGNNLVGWSNPQADQLLVQGRQELDQAKRKDIYFQFQNLIHNDAPYYFLWADKRVAAFTKSVKGEIDLQSPLYYWNLSTWNVQQ